MMFALYFLLLVLCVGAAIYFFVDKVREVGKLTEANASLMERLSQMSTKMRHLADHNVAMLKRVSDSRRELFKSKGEMKFNPETDLVSVDDVHEETEGSELYRTISFPAEPIELFYTGSTRATSAQLYDGRTQAKIYQDIVHELTHGLAASMIAQDMVAFHIILDPDVKLGERVNVPSVTVMARFYGHRIGKPLREVFGEAFPPPLPPPGDLLIKPTRKENAE